jgi:hypothetical protein
MLTNSNEKRIKENSNAESEIIPLKKIPKRWKEALLEFGRFDDDKPKQHSIDLWFNEEGNAHVDDEKNRERWSGDRVKRRSLI